jgi:hypothetical protein
LFPRGGASTFINFQLRDHQPKSLLGARSGGHNGKLGRMNSLAVTRRNR